MNVTVAVLAALVPPSSSLTTRLTIAEPLSSQVTLAFLEAALSNSQLPPLVMPESSTVQ